MTDTQKAPFSAYMATPIMSIIGNIIASLIFIFALNDSSPVPVFAVFTVINIINMTLFALLPKKRKPIVQHINKVLFSLTLMVVFGTLGRQNFQIEGLFFFTLAGVFGGVTTHFLMAKIVGPIFFWTQLVLLELLDSDATRFVALQRWKRLAWQVKKR